MRVPTMLKVDEVPNLAKADFSALSPPNRRMEGLNLGTSLKG
jgi:hypothetical protein